MDNTQVHYFDYAATTPLDTRVLEQMLPYLTQKENFANPASDHHLGTSLNKAINRAAEQVAETINGHHQGIIWTSGATEANNLAIIGTMEFYNRKGKHIVTSEAEHKAILAPCQYLSRQGYEVTVLKPNKHGVITPEAVAQVLRADTVLVSLTHANSETGVLQDIQAIGQRAHQMGALLHVDAAQSAGKQKIDMQKQHIDLLSLSGHKIYGPQGIGALAIRQTPRLRLKPRMFGGSQQMGLRPGTLPAFLIVGFAKAMALANQEYSSDNERITSFHDKIVDALQGLPGIHFHGDFKHKLASHINFRIDGVNGYSLRQALAAFALSSGSACSASQQAPSYVLQSMGLTAEQAQNAIRISLGRFTKTDEVELLIKHLQQQILLSNKES